MPCLSNSHEGKDSVRKRVEALRQKGKEGEGTGRLVGQEGMEEEWVGEGKGRKVDETWIREDGGGGAGGGGKAGDCKELGRGVVGEEGYGGRERGQNGGG